MASDARDVVKVQVTWCSVTAEPLARFCSRLATKDTAESSRCRLRAQLFFFVTVFVCRTRKQCFTHRYHIIIALNDNRLMATG